MCVLIRQNNLFLWLEWANSVYYERLRTYSDFIENQPKQQNKNFSKTSHKLLWLNLYTPFI